MKKSLPVLLTLCSLVLQFFGSSVSQVHASNTLYFLHQDHLGSTRVVTDKDSHVLARYDYYPYGDSFTRTQMAYPMASIFN